MPRWPHRLRETPSRPSRRRAARPRACATIRRPDRRHGPSARSGTRSRPAGRRVIARRRFGALITISVPSSRRRSGRFLEIHRCRDPAPAGHDRQDPPIRRPGLDPVLDDRARRERPASPADDGQGDHRHADDQRRDPFERRVPDPQPEGDDAEQEDATDHDGRRPASRAGRSSGPGSRSPRRRAATSRSIGKTPPRSGRVSVPTTLSGPVNEIEPRDRRTSTTMKMTGQRAGAQREVDEPRRRRPAVGRPVRARRRSGRPSG